MTKSAFPFWSHLLKKSLTENFIMEFSLITQTNLQVCFKFEHEEKNIVVKVTAGPTTKWEI